MARDGPSSGFDGTISTLSERGYARTTVREICGRAGLSPGALFGRFDTLTDLMLAAAREVARRHVDAFARHVAELPDDRPSTVLPLIRASARDPINAVWIELQVAARTDPVLRERLGPVVAEFAAAMLSAGDRLPLLRRVPEQARPVVVAHVVHYFDGEALSGVLYPHAEFDAQRMAMLTTVLELYLDAKASSADS
jgi:AcrR family transcriptional regulator